MQHALTSKWTLTSGYQDLMSLSAHGFYFERFWGTDIGWCECYTLCWKWQDGWLYTSLCRVGNSWGLHVYVHDGHGCNMHQQVDGLSHWVTKIWRAFRLTVPILKVFGEPTLVDVRVILLVENDKMDEYIHPHIELETLRARMVTWVGTTWLSFSLYQTMTHKQRFG